MVILKGNKITIGKISVGLTNPFWRNTKSILVNVLKQISIGIAKGKVHFNNPNTTVSWMFENRVIVSENKHEINTSYKRIYMVTKAFFVYYRSALWNARKRFNVLRQKYNILECENRVQNCRYCHGICCLVHWTSTFLCHLT